jgi:hypothetical protein
VRAWCTNDRYSVFADMSLTGEKGAMNVQTSGQLPRPALDVGLYNSALMLQQLALACYVLNGCPTKDGWIRSRVPRGPLAQVLPRDPRPGALRARDSHQPEARGDRLLLRQAFSARPSPTTTRPSSRTTGIVEIQHPTAAHRRARP